MGLVPCGRLGECGEATQVQKLTWHPGGAQESIQNDFSPEKLKNHVAENLVMFYHVPSQNGAYLFYSKSILVIG